MPRLRNAEREALENARYDRELKDRVNSIIAAGEREGRKYTEDDRRTLMDFHDERNIPDREAVERWNKRQRLENNDAQND